MAKIENIANNVYIGISKIFFILNILNCRFDLLLILVCIKINNMLEIYFSFFLKMLNLISTHFMAGHSHAHNIMFKKGANDAKKAKLFTKIARDISIAVKNGLPDPDLNPKLKILVAKARTLNMPKDKIETAIAKANKDTTNYENVRYNAFFDRGISLIIEGLTDNKNRTASDVRSTLSKFGAEMSPSGSVEYMYTHIGRIIYSTDVCDEEKMFEMALEAGANDVYIEDDIYVIETTIEDMLDVVASLSKILGKEPQSAGWFWKANDYVGDDIKDKEFIEKYQKLLDALDDIDDVSEVYTNADIECEE